MPADSSPPRDAGEFADSLVRVTRSLVEPALRVAYVRATLRDTPLPLLALGLDRLCQRAQEAEEGAREVLVAVVDVLNEGGPEVPTQRLRALAASESLLALERLVRASGSIAPHSSRVPDPPPNEAKVPDYGAGRTLTLGERKALARRADRSRLTLLFSDPHPDVIFRVLRNPRVTEDDVLRLASKRPVRPDVLAEIARSPRWAHRTRVRMALVLNPDTPFEIAARISGLLVRQELKLVCESTSVPSAVRALCMEHLKRRPPMPFDDEGDGPVQ